MIGIEDYTIFRKNFFSRIEEINPNEIATTLSLLRCCNSNIFVIGNGGSMSTASHFAQDLLKIGNKRAIALNNISAITAWANDEGYENCFVEQLKVLADPGDILVIISGSGNSLNVINAMYWARDNDITTVGITGFDGGIIGSECKYGINVPCYSMSMVEAIHSFLLHYLVMELKYYVS
jgi:D-sedoheptulose 7-phosphate isomerase